MFDFLLIFVVLDAGRFTRKDLFFAGQLQCIPQPQREPHESISIAIDEHVTRALHVGLLVTDKRVCFQDFYDTSAAGLALESVFSEGQSRQGVFMFGKSIFCVSDSVMQLRSRAIVLTVQIQESTAPAPSTI